MALLLRQRVLQKFAAQQCSLQSGTFRGRAATVQQQAVQVQLQAASVHTCTVVKRDYSDDVVGGGGAPWMKEARENSVRTHARTHVRTHARIILPLR